MKNLLVSGYRAFELGVFKENDPKVTVIKKNLKDMLVNELENGLEWVILSGQSGVEMWAAEVVIELKESYPELQLALITAHLDFGQNWKEESQNRLAKIRAAADYANSTSHKPYSDPSQLREHQQFLLSHTDGALLLYDPEFEGKPMYLYRAVRRLMEQKNYELRLIDFDMLQNSILD